MQKKCSSTIIIVALLLCAGMFTLPSCIKPPQEAPDTLDGKWLYGNEYSWKYSPVVYNEDAFSINIADSVGTFDDIKAGQWLGALIADKIKYGDPYLKNIKKINSSTWTCDVLQIIHNDTDANQSIIRWSKASISMGDFYYRANKRSKNSMIEIYVSDTLPSGYHAYDNYATFSRMLPQ
jgi:hypothetical protein